MLLDYAHLVASSSRERAVQLLQAYLNVRASDTDARLFLGSMLVSLDRFEEALTAVRPISEVGSSRQLDDLLYMRAYSFLRLNYYYAARTVAEKLKSTTTSETIRSRAEDLLRSIALHPASAR